MLCFKKVAIAAIDLHRVDIVDEVIEDLQAEFDPSSLRVRRIMVI